MLIFFSECSEFILPTFRRYFQNIPDSFFFSSSKRYNVSLKTFRLYFLNIPLYFFSLEISGDVSIFILEPFQLYSPNIPKIFSKHSDFLFHEVLQQFSGNIPTLLSEHSDFILQACYNILLRIYCEKKLKYFILRKISLL